MSSPRYPDVSLYQLALEYQPVPKPVKVWAKGFKGIVQSITEYLAEQKISATCWLKLPSGAAWQEAVSAYLYEHQLAEAAYFLSSHGLDDEKLLAYSDAEVAERISIIPLAPKSGLRGEYILLFISNHLTGFVLARRFRVQPGTSPPDDEAAEDTALGAPEISEPSRERKYYLRVICSFDPQFVRHILQGLQSAIAASAAGYSESAEAMTIAQNLELQSAQIDLQPMSFSLLDRLITQQLANQARLQQTLASARRQALAVSDLSSQNEELLNTLKLRDDFLNTVGQELRAPLTSIKTALTLLSSSNLKGPQRQRYMEMIGNECDRQSTLINGVLNLLHLEGELGQVDIQPLQLADVVPGVVSTYQPIAQEKGVMLAYTISEDLPPTSCPETWVRQIVINLLHNSIRFTPEGGEVWVTARSLHELIELQFRDTGAGIASADLPKIFDHFYRGRQISNGEAEGAGLGLTIVQQLLLYCGGSIKVESEVGQGSIFRVLLPIYQQ
ncbi:MAG: histidine kinase [Leptolyngbyaceae cyanobacterium SM1_1_3]|nr:histidine kinase [Leptolyngbyaceae cyanobacterium SM1_1_3]NJN04733.1 histidine kinase [Leptolyngbyaceae cyanobacterium RM1_1_2]NJO10920.1 histidine kinase [Leptolyngbyaceae cyanobacterium SL_1_1]